MKEILIENGIKHKCPNCNTVLSIENEKEILYRKITLLHRNKITGKEEMKCRQCRTMISNNC
jgi:hypothetical protein